jgi:hypothetical protein
MTTETEITTRVLFRCERCRRTIRVDYVTIVTRERLDADSAFERVTRRYKLAGGTESYWLPAEACPTCGRMMARSLVEGTMKAGVRCTPRCTGAEAPKCVCSCGGANHGRRWLRR